MSEKIELILYIFTQCKSDAKWYESKVKDEECKENNIRHELEGIIDENGNRLFPPAPPKYRRRAVLATKQQDTLIARRIAKDNIAICQPLIEFLNSTVGKETINKLNQKLGEIRKIEKNMDERIYHMRETNKTPKNPEKSKNLDNLIRDWKQSIKK